MNDDQNKTDDQINQPVVDEQNVSEPEEQNADNTDVLVSDQPDQTDTPEPENEAENTETAPEEVAEQTDQTDTVTSEEQPEEETAEPVEQTVEESDDSGNAPADTSNVAGARWYVVHTYSGHENRVATALKQRVESEHLENKIVDVLVPTQDKIEIRSGKKETITEKIFPGYILVKMVLDDDSWLAVRTTQGVTSFVGMGNKPTPISESEVKSIVNFMQQEGQPTYKQIFSEGDTVKIVDGPFTEFIGKIENVDKEKGKVRVLVSIFGRETPVELDFFTSR